MADGLFDLGITGRDWVEETGANVVSLGEMRYSKQTSRPIRVVLAVPQDGHITHVGDLPDGAWLVELASMGAVKGEGEGRRARTWRSRRSPRSGSGMRCSAAHRMRNRWTGSSPPSASANRS